MMSNKNKSTPSKTTDSKIKATSTPAKNNNLQRNDGGNDDESIDNNIYQSRNTGKNIEEVTPSSTSSKKRSYESDDDEDHKSIELSGVNTALNSIVKTTLDLYKKSTLGTSETLTKCKKDNDFLSNWDMFKDSRRGLLKYLDDHDQDEAYSDEQRESIESLVIQLGQNYKLLREAMVQQTELDAKKKRKSDNNVIISNQSLRVNVHKPEKLDYDTIRKFRDELRCLDSPLSNYTTKDRQNLLSDQVRMDITMILWTKNAINKADVAAWENWDDAKFFEILLEALTPVKLNKSDDERMESNFNDISFHIDWNNIQTTLNSSHYDGLKALRIAKKLKDGHLDDRSTIEPAKFATALWDTVLTNFEKKELQKDTEIPISIWWLVQYVATPSF